MDLLMELMDAATPASAPAATPHVTPGQSSTAQPARNDGTRMDDRTPDASMEDRKKEGDL